MAATPQSPTFFSRRDYAGLYTEWVTVADTNGDGIPDLIANEQGYIQVLFGNGNGTFRPGPDTHSVLAGAGRSVAVDLNGDGKVDLVFNGNLEQGQAGVAVCLGNGDGTFQSGTFYRAGNESEQTIGQAVVGDFNGDGIPDVAVAGSSGVWLFTGKGDGTLNPGAVAAALAPVQGGDLAAADFNGDKKLDLVFAMPYAGTDGTGNGFVVLLGNGDGTFQSPQAFAEPKRPFNLTVGPLTKGGPASIALTSGSDVYLYFGNGAGGFSGPRVVSLPGIGGIAIGDVNGDGIPDLVSSGGYIALGTDKGTFTKPFSYPIDSAGGSWNVVLADLRNNGLTDIVTDGYDAISVLLSRSKGYFEDGLWTKVTGGAACGVAADFNNDGKPDLAVNTPTGVAILMGTGNVAAPLAAGATMTLSNTGCILTGDLNGDGIADLLVTTPTAVVSYIGNGDGTFTQKSSTTVGPGLVVLGDFNHDGKLDFATSGNQLATGNGDGTFQTPAAFVSSPPPGGFSNIATGDINNDGWPDIVLTNADIPYSNLYVLLNNQKGGFTQVPTSFGALTDQAVLVDVNGDGNLDLVTSGIDGGGNYVYLGNGQGGFTFAVGLEGPPGAGTQFDIVTDLNGDGIPDIAILGSNTVAVYLGTGGATYATQFCIGVGPSPTMLLVENLHGQSPSAGLPDIVSPDYAGGVMVLLNLTK